AGMGSAPGKADGLGLDVLLEPFDAVLAPYAARLVAAEGRLHAVPDATVDRHRPGPHLVGEGQSPILGAGEHATPEPVLAVVGDADGVGVVVEGDDDEHGAEDLLLGNGHRVVDPGENRGLDVVPLGQVRGPAPSCHQAGAFGLALVDVAEDAVALPGAD